MKQTLKASFALAIAMLLGGTTIGARPAPAAKNAPEQGDTEKTELDRVRIAIGMRRRHSAIRLAASELTRFLCQMVGDPAAADVVEDGDETIADLELGLFADFGLPLDGMDDPILDDAIHIDVRDSRGTIAGSNPRSVLFVAYRFLEACGCRWIRPGPDGDYVPSRRIDGISVQLSDRAAYRFRGNNNCGSYSLDHVLAKIAWAPKVGLNTFFGEFFLPRFLFNDWYGRNYPSHKAPELRSDGEICAYQELVAREVKRRGMLYHAVGHGWTGKFFGNPETECDHFGTLVVPANEEKYLALVKGKRVKGGPTTTDLCYGQPEVRRRLASLVADYAEAHSEVDYLHFWLDDRMNNSCECDLCRGNRLSDWYVMILNDVALEPFRLNQNKMPSDVKLNVAYLREWQRQFPGPGFVFDYHMIWHHYHDAGYYGLTDVLAEDIRRLPKLGLDGFVSCQIVRAFYPHGFPLHAHARLLWDPQADMKNLAEEYFAGAFGNDGPPALEHMKSLSELFSPTYFYRIRQTRTSPPADAQATLVADGLERASRVVSEFQPVIERNLQTSDPARKLSWKHLSVHAETVTRLAEVLRARVEDRRSDEDVHWKELLDHLADREDDIDGVFDAKWFDLSVARRH